LLHLRTFGCDAYVHIPKEKRHKMDVKNQKFILVGYNDNAKLIDYTIPLPALQLLVGMSYSMRNFNYKT
jgi:hypothetical protein